MRKLLGLASLLSGILSANIRLPVDPGLKAFTELSQYPYLAWVYLAHQNPELASRFSVIETDLTKVRVQFFLGEASVSAEIRHLESKSGIATYEIEVASSIYREKETVAVDLRQVKTGELIITPQGTGKGLFRELVVGKLLEKFWMKYFSPQAQKKLVRLLEQHPPLERTLHALPIILAERSDATRKSITSTSVPPSFLLWPFVLGFLFCGTIVVVIGYLQRKRTT